MDIDAKKKKELRKLLERISTPEEMKAFDMELLSEKSDKTTEKILSKIEEAKPELKIGQIDSLVARATAFLADKIDVLNSKKIPIYDDSELKKRIENLADGLHEHASVRQAAAFAQKQMVDETKKTNEILVQIGELLRQKEEHRDPVELKSIDETLLESYKQLKMILAKTGSNDSMRIKNSSAVVIDPATEETLQSIAGFSIPAYDYISLGYTGSNLTTVVFYIGGSGGTILNTLTLGYDVNNNLTSVTKS